MNENNLTQELTWVSVNERMPEKIDQYLVTNGKTVLICGLLPNSTFYGIGGATYWAKVPTIPKDI